jgi:PAS domain S-box-containing protein
MDKTKNNLIIIAEDSPTQAENLKYILEKNGYKVAYGLNGQETLNLVEKDKPLLIIADIIMPVMDGYELCRQVKADENLREVPVILLTSLSEAEDVLKGLACGADSYVMKPFKEQHLMFRIQSILASKPSSGEKEVKQESIDILFAGKKYFVKSTKYQILNLLLSTYEGAVQKTQKLKETQAALSVFRASLEKKIEEKIEYLRQEIKKRKRIETAIRASEKKYHNLVENAIVGVFSLNLEGRLLFVNEAFCALLQYDSVKELTSRTFQSLCNKPKNYEAFLETIRKNRHVRNFEIELVSKSDQTRWVIVNAFMKGENLSGMILDITERKKTEEKEKSYQDKLRVAKEKAEESNKLKTAFLFNISHEVRTPMNVITGFSSLLSDPDILTENRAEFINRISESCYSLLNLIENILDIAKLEASKLKIYEKECSLNQLLENIYSTFSKEKSVRDKDKISFRLQTAIQEKDFSILTDPVRIYQILSNLLDNAFKFTETGFIEFGYTVQDDTLQFFVKDTGVGLSGDQKKLVFESFRRAEDLETKIYSGAGLGLAICKRLVMLIGGKIWVESESGNGSTFCFTVPLKVAEKPVVDLEKKVPTPESYSLKGKKILVAEDNLLNYKLVEAILGKTEASIFWAKDGIEAVEFFNSGFEFDIVLMDIRMPNMDGFQATQEIRQLKKELPVIAVTAYGLGNEKDIAMETGFNDYLTKPVNSEKLIETINKYIHNGV